MKKLSLLVLSVLITIFLTACATSKEAQTLARATISQTINYENQLNEKIEAEIKYYQESLESIISSVEYSQNIMTVINRATLDVQKATLISKNDLAPIDITIYTDNLLNNIQNIKISNSSLIKEYNENFQNSLVQLDNKKASIKTIKQGLEKLQADPTEAEQLNLWFKFAKDIQDNIEAPSDKK